VAPKPVVEVNPAAAPVEAPKEIAPEPPDTSFERAQPAGIAGGVIGGVVGGIPEAPPPPPPPPPAAPVRVGGNIKPPMKTKDVRPSYPPIAQSARVQGVVIIEATIGPNGKVQDARVLRSIPLLDAAALDAVRQWEFTPTLLNGVPVPVIMTVTVQFTLS
jgi:protein TonB